MRHYIRLEKKDGSVEIFPWGNLPPLWFQNELPPVTVGTAEDALAQPVVKSGFYQRVGVETTGHLWWKEATGTYRWMPDNYLNRNK